MRDLNFDKTRIQNRNKLKKPPVPLGQRLPLKKGGRILGVLAMVAMVAFFGAELYTRLFRVSLLNVERIEVTNLQRLQQEEVLAMTGVNPGEDMFGLDLRRIGAQLEKNPWIKTVRVKRRFPHTLAIEVTEREPVAIVNLGYLYYLDRDGELFKPLAAGDRLDYPILTGLGEDDAGKDPKRYGEALKSAVEIIALLRAGTSFTLEDVSEIHLEPGFGVTLITVQGGVPVRLGNERFAEKLTRLARIYKELQAQMPALSYIDLDYNDRIIVKKG